MRLLFVKGIRFIGLALMAVFVFGAPASAFANESGPGTMIPEAAQKALEEGERAESQLTDPKAAEQLPHRDLERAQVLQLLSEVFGTQIEGVAGVFNDLDVDHFLSDNAAVIDAGDQPEASGVVIGEGEYHGPALLESTVPLRTEDQSGKEATVDLGLEHAEGEIQPATPLVEVGIPSELGEGIQLPQSEVEIALAGAPQERAPSIVGQTVAVYPEVAEDTSLAVAPSPTGVETFTLLQSADAPNSATYQLNLPEGASLSATDDGGAEVSTGDESLLRILPPAAMDAEGNDVPVTLEVSGSSFTVHAEPPQGAAYPILVDPVVESHNWYGYQNPDGLAAWQGTSNDKGLLYNKQSALGYPGTDLRAVKGFGLKSNAQAQWAYSVPRYEEDQKEFGAPPTSYISSMVLTNLFFVTNEDKSAYPWMAAGIWDNSVANWASAWAHPGNTGNLENLATTYTFNTTNQNAKQAIDNVLWAGEAHTMTSDRETYVGYATVEIADAVASKIGSFTPPEGWVGNTAPAIPYSVTDTGLGVKEMKIGQVGGGPQTQWTTSLTCSGNASYPCPRSWKSGVTYPTLKYTPGNLPQGIDKMTAVAKDPAGNTSAPYEFTLKVDHTAPEMKLSGSMYQQSRFNIPHYTLNMNDSDGTEASPQSGVASTEITVDGKKVDSTSPGCPTQNCSLSRKWTLNATEYAVGKHTVIVKATDGAGNTSEKTLSVNVQPDTTPPEILEASGSLETAPSGWIEQKTYKINLITGDVGYGVTSVVFKMDGKIVQEQKGTCPEGDCKLSFVLSTSIAGYKGGAHSAEYVITDGAGNVTTKKWTVKVDPNGAVSAAEAVDTIEAIEETSEASPVGPSEAIYAPAEIEAGIDPSLEQSGSELHSTGTAATTVMTTNAHEAFTIEGAEGNVAITPVGGAGGTVSEVAAEVAAVSGGTGVDTVIRPIYDGDQTFKTIRDETAPEAYSWKVSLNKSQTLKVIDSEHAAIFNSDESQALAITAEAAHDATGKAVPTGLSVSEGNVLTLTVKYKGKGFTYPIIGGPAFQSSYTLPVIWEPPPPAEERYWESGETIVGPPEPIPSGEASISMEGGSRKEFVQVICGHSEFYDGGYSQACGNPFKHEIGFQTPWQLAMRGAFFYKPGKEVEQRGAIACAGLGWETSTISRYYIEPAYQCHYGPKTSDGNGGATAGAGHYLRAQAHWKLGHNAKCIEGCPGENPVIWEDRAMELHLWPSGIVDETVPN
jgi:hypothetical protein